MDDQQLLLKYRELAVLQQQLEYLAVDSLAYRIASLRVTSLQQEISKLSRPNSNLTD